MSGLGTDVRILGHIPLHPFPLRVLYKEGEREEGRKERAILCAAGALLRSNDVKKLEMTN